MDINNKLHFYRIKDNIKVEKINLIGEIDYMYRFSVPGGKVINIPKGELQQYGVYMSRVIAMTELEDKLYKAINIIRLELQEYKLEFMAKPIDE